MEAQYSLSEIMIDGHYDSSFLSCRYKEKSKKMWVSFGIFMILLQFLDGYEIVCLQSANRFCYSIAVSRVQLIIRIERTVYFTWADGDSELLKNRLILYSERTGVKLLKQKASEPSPIKD